jgi:hypothetical protein
MFFALFHATITYRQQKAPWASRRLRRGLLLFYPSEEIPPRVFILAEFFNHQESGKIFGNRIERETNKT